MVNKSILIRVTEILIVLSLCSTSYAAKPVLVNVQIDVESESDKEYVYDILGEIEKRGWSVTVYFTGEFAMEHPDIVKDIHDKKHQIAVCGWTSGEDLTLFSFEEQLELINESFNAVRNAINKLHHAYIADFKPQGLKQDENTFKALQQLNVRSNAGFLASETKTHPYHTDYGFIAIPIATVKQGFEDIPLIDELILTRSDNIGDYLSYHIQRYDESLATKEPFTISIRPSIIASDEERLYAFTLFLDYVQQTGGQVVMTDHITTLANPYMSNLILDIPSVTCPGKSVWISGSYYAYCDCPDYYIRIYGKYPGDVFWQLLDQFVNEDADVGPHEFFREITIPNSDCNETSYTLRAVGRACHGTCWPTAYDYEVMSQTEVEFTDKFESCRLIDVSEEVTLISKEESYEITSPWEITFQMWDLDLNCAASYLKSIPNCIACAVIAVPCLSQGMPPSYCAQNQYCYDCLPDLGISFEDLCDTFKDCSLLHTLWKKTRINIEKEYNKITTTKTYRCYSECYGYNIKEETEIRFEENIKKGNPFPVLKWTYGEHPDESGLDGENNNQSNNTLQILELAIEDYISSNTSKNYTFFVDSVANSIMFSLQWSKGELDSTIHDPNGAIIESNFVYSNLDVMSEEITPFKSYYINKAKDGIWTLNVFPVELPTEGTDFTIITYIETNINLFISTDKNIYSPDESIGITATVKNNSELLYNLTIFAEITRPDNTTDNITLYDDGSHGDTNANDGNYINYYTDTSIEGDYAIVVYALGNIENNNYRRVKAKTIKVKLPRADLIDYYEDYGKDTDADGLFNYLSIDVDANVIVPGYYNLTGWLSKNGEDLLYADSNAYLNSGIRTIQLNFDGLTIYRAGLDGPYNLSYLILTNDTGIADYRYDAYTTSSYTYSEFQKPKAEFTAYYSDFGIDNNANGLFDYLGIEIGINAAESGNYSIEGLLANNDEITWTSDYTHLNTGYQTIQLNFDGMAICEHGVNGPYRVDVGIYDVNGIQMDYTEGYSTEPYNYTDFQCGGQITGLVIDRNSRQPIENAYSQVSEKGDTILSDDFNDNWLSSNWSSWPPGPRFSFAETNGEIKIDRVSIESGWDNLQYRVPVNQDVEASVRVRTPNLPDGTEFSFFIFNGGPGSDYGGPEWGCYLISMNHEGYIATGFFKGQEYWGSSIGLFGDEDKKFHTYKIIYEKSKERILFFIDDICICTTEDVNFIDFEFQFGADCWGLGMDANVDIRVDDFLVKEFTGLTPEIKGTASTDPNGAYTINRLLPATYEISVLPPDGKNLLPDSAIVVLDEDEAEIANFILEEGGIVSGCVRDSNDVKISGAYVEASGPGYSTAVTDVNGIYKLTGLESKIYNISVIPPPYANLMEATATIQAVKGKTKTMDLTLQPAGSIAGRVTDANGTPVTNVYLFLSGHEMPRYSVDEDGRYTIPGLYAGAYTLNTDAVETEFLDDSKTVSVRLGHTTNADFVLQKGRTFVNISGYVKNTAGEPLSDAPVWIENTQNDMGWTNTTNEDGYFEFTNLSDGIYEIVINDDWPKLSEYTAVGFKDDKLVNVTEDLIMSFTLQRIEVNVVVDPRIYSNGDTIDVEITATNNDIQDLVNWSAYAELENDEDDILDYNIAPINIAVGDTNSVNVTLNIPEDNTSADLNLDVDIRTNLLVSSNIGPLNTVIYQEVELDRIIQIREQTERYEEDFETGDFSGLNWILSGDENWFVTPEEKSSGSYSAQAGEIDDNENTSLSVTLDCNSGDITFYLKVSSESNWDFLKFYIDEEEQDQWSGEQDWMRVSFHVEEGTRTFKWVYEKDSIISQGSDTTWIDDITFRGFGPPQAPLRTATEQITDTKPRVKKH